MPGKVGLIEQIRRDLRAFGVRRSQNAEVFSRRCALPQQGARTLRLLNGLCVGSREWKGGDSRSSDGKVNETLQTEHSHLL
jgi:hypothetical protein